MKVFLQLYVSQRTDGLKKVGRLKNTVKTTEIIGTLSGVGRQDSSPTVLRDSWRSGLSGADGAGRMAMASLTTWYRVLVMRGDGSSRR